MGNFSESHASMIEQPESGTVRIQGIANLARVYRGPVATAQALQAKYEMARKSPEGVLGRGSLQGWILSGTELREETPGVATLTVIWRNARSPFFIRPRDVTEVEPC
jgi:hypothetical protein